MQDIAKYFQDNHKDFSTIVIPTNLYLTTIQPWLEWPQKTSFWEAYNAIKHQGAMEKATLENTIKALAGHFALLLFWIKKENKDFPANNTNFDLPKFFYYEGIKVLPTSGVRKVLNIPGLPYP